MTTQRIETALAKLSARDISLIAERQQGMNDLRNLLGVGGIYGRAVNAQDERLARAVMDGLQDGWYLAGDQGEGFTGAERTAYLTALELATRVAPAVAA
jgi:hypothetical protein